MIASDPIDEASLPEEIVKAFDGADLEHKVGLAYLLITTDPDGTPRPCMLSCGEVLAMDNRHLRLAVWPETHTSENLARGTRALFCFVAPGMVCYIRGRTQVLGRDASRRWERFELTVDSVHRDQHRGMPVTNTITYRTMMPEDTVAAAWREQIAALREG